MSDAPKLSHKRHKFLRSELLTVPTTYLSQPNNWTLDNGKEAAHGESEVFWREIACLMWVSEWVGPVGKRVNA